MKKKSLPIIFILCICISAACFLLVGRYWTDTIVDECLMTVEHKQFILDNYAVHYSLSGQLSDGTDVWLSCTRGEYESCTEGDRRVIFRIKTVSKLTGKMIATKYQMKEPSYD